MSQMKGDRSHGHQWGLRVGTEIVASTVIGLGMGYYIDKWLDTRPLFLLVFFLFGVIAGFLNLYRVVRLDQEKMGKK
jgi:ATP synthase protein I